VTDPEIGGIQENRKRFQAAEKVFHLTKKVFLAAGAFGDCTVS
jgi:hypothetical protein